MATCALTCADAKKIDLVDYLASLGHHPQKVSHPDYWYLSPFRDEKTASFKVNRKLNVYYDHGTGMGGDLIDFGTRFYNCSVSDFLHRLAGQLQQNSLSFHPPTQTSKAGLQPANRDTLSAGEKKETQDRKILIISDRQIGSKQLLEYLKTRCIPLEIANRYCREVNFLLYDKKHTVIGFKNKAGGFELRSENFKGSSSPKDITFIDNRTDDVAVFEGFFSFLSFCTVNKNLTAPLTNCLILNSISIFEKSHPLMEQYEHVHLFLDRDTAGIKHTLQALEWNKEKYIDRSDHYKNHKDLNDWLIHNSHNLRQCLKPGRLL
jgi:DNA primase